MSTGQVVSVSIVVLIFAGYLTYRAFAVKRAREEIQGVQTLAKSHDDRLKEQLIRTVEHTIAVNKNSELLKENTALLKELLEKRGGPDT